MNNSQTQAMNRLLKKLTAVRSTLNKDERDLLDKILTNAQIQISTDANNVQTHLAKIGRAHV